MGTPGRKRNPVRETFAAEDDALGHIAKEVKMVVACCRACTMHVNVLLVYI